MGRSPTKIMKSVVLIQLLLHMTATFSLFQSAESAKVLKYDIKEKEKYLNEMGVMIGLNEIDESTLDQIRQLNSFEGELDITAIGQELKRLFYGEDNIELDTISALPLKPSKKKEVKDEVEELLPIPPLENPLGVQVPDHFRYYDIAHIYKEVYYRQAHNNRWSERTILEILYHSFTDQISSPSQIDERPNKRTNGNKKYSSHSKLHGSGPKSKLKYWMDKEVNICFWEGITCGVITAGAGLGKSTSFSGLPIIYSNIDCWCVPPNDEDEWDWPTEEEVEDLELFGIGKIVEREEERIRMKITKEKESGLFETQLNENIEDLDKERLRKKPVLLEKVRKYRKEKKEQCVCDPGMIPQTYPPNNAVTKIDLMEFGLTGTIPPELAQLPFLHRLNLNLNNLHGTIPSEFGDFQNLHFLDLGENQLTGTIPKELALLSNTLDELWLERNLFTGTFPDYLTPLRAEFIDLNGNLLTGTLPSSIGDFKKLVSLYLQGNSFTGKIPTELGNLSLLKAIDLGENNLTGSIPSEIGYCWRIMELDLGYNELTGPFPSEILSFENMESFSVSGNGLTGTLPDMFVPSKDVIKEHKSRVIFKYGDLSLYDEFDDSDTINFPDREVFTWSFLSRLEYLAVGDNYLRGTIPPVIFGPYLRYLDLSENFFEGTVPQELYLSEGIEKLQIQSNLLVGSLPESSHPLTELIFLNVTDNIFNGTVPSALCNTVANKDFSKFGCDSVLCPAGTFNPEGVASEFVGSCVDCPQCVVLEESEKVESCFLLGQMECSGNNFEYPYIIGDIDGDRELSQREILRLLYLFTGGACWGKSFEEWGDMEIDECDLVGVGCQDGIITKLDLRGATLCNENSEVICEGLPSVVSLLDSLEVLDLSNAFFSQFNIPEEIGLLTNLKVIDFSRNSGLSGTIPSEIGGCSNLTLMNLSQGNLEGEIPEAIGNLLNLEKINLSQNRFSGTIPSTIGKLYRLKEIIVSRAHLSGSLPREIGYLSFLENLEFYGNSLTGTIPNSISNCAALKRIDLFNNLLTGTIPHVLSQLTQIQIIHLKGNLLGGTIPDSFGQLQMLSWLDLSLNRIVGTIPSSLGGCLNLRDLRLGSNLLQGPVPSGLCRNKLINGGLLRDFSCDFIACPLGTFSEDGYATIGSLCKLCPNGQTTLSLGSKTCRTISQRDFLTIFYDVMKGEKWSQDSKDGWKDPNQSECNWNGITCDSDGNIISMSFPFAAAKNMYPNYE